MWLKRHKQARTCNVNYFVNISAQSSPTLYPPGLFCSSKRQEYNRSTNHAVKSAHASPLRRGSKSWSAPLWAASWCHRSSSSRRAGSSGCHCRLRHSMLAAAHNCPGSTKLLLFLCSKEGLAEPHSAEPSLTFSLCRSQCRDLQNKIHSGISVSCQSVHF